MIKITAVDPQDLPAILRIERLGSGSTRRRSARWLYRRSSR